jgi:UDP-3-O-[3-hydroxymyristoyl] glucosamine N-acyltransferase
VRVSEIAGQLEAAWEGEGEREITGVAPLDSAGDSDLAFAAGRKAVAAAEFSRAGCLLVSADFPAGRTLIRVSDPRAACARAIRLLYPAMDVLPGIHGSAVIAEDAQVATDASVGPHVSVGSGAEIGRRSRIGAGCSIGSGARIGDDCVLYANVTVYGSVSIGNRVVLHSGCVLGADGFGFVLTGGRYEKFPQIGRVEIGDGVEIGANSCVDRAALGVTRIGEGTKIDNMVHVGHNCEIGKHVVIAAQTGLSGGVVVGDHVVIGGQVGIGDKARIESGAVLGSGAGVLTSKIVRRGQVMWGTPARPLREYLEQLAQMGRLAELRAEVVEIERRLRELEGGG